MGDVLTFAPRPKPVSAQLTSEPLTSATRRARIEAAAEVAVDTAERLIALLDDMDGDPDLEDGADAEPSLAAPEQHHGSQVVWMRGGDKDLEAEVPETALPVVAVEDRSEATVLRWGGRGNVVAAAGVVLVDLVSRPCR